MTRARRERELIRKYLLGRANDQDQDEVQNRLLSDADFFQKFEIIEQQLTEERIWDTLPNAERADFDNYFLAAPERRENFLLTKALKSYAEEVQSQSRSQIWPRRLWPRLAPLYLISTVLIIAIGVISLTHSPSGDPQLRNDLEQLRRQSELREHDHAEELQRLQQQLLSAQERNSALSIQLEQYRAEQSLIVHQLDRVQKENAGFRQTLSRLRSASGVNAGNLLATNIENVLRPAARGGGQQVLRIASGASQVPLQLILDPEKAKDSRYRIELQDVNGRVL